MEACSTNCSSCVTRCGCGGCSTADPGDEDLAGRPHRPGARRRPDGRPRRVGSPARRQPDRARPLDREPATCRRPHPERPSRGSASARRLDLIDAVEQRRRRASPARGGPARRRARVATVVIPRVRASGHRGAELRSLTYHWVVANGSMMPLLADALARLRRWRDDSRIHPHYADRWAELLTGPRARLLDALARDDDDAAALRQSSPFAGALDEHERRDAADRRQPSV